MAKKRLNKNVVVGLTLFGFLVMIVLSVVMLSQLRKRDPKYFVDLAEQSVASEHWEQAALFYREAWRRSEDAAHLVRLGDALLELGNVPQTLEAWQQALLAQPDLLDAHRAQLEVLLELAELNMRAEPWKLVRDAAENMRDVSAGVSEPDKAYAMYALGMSLLHLSSVDPAYRPKGFEAIEQAVALDPETVSYAIDLAEQYVQRDRRDDAKALLDDLLSKHTNPGDASSRVLAAYAMFQANQGETDAARTYFEKALAFATDAPDALFEAELAFSAFQIDQWAKARQADADDAVVAKHFEQAEALLRQSIEQSPDRYEPYLQLATLYKTAQRYSDAVDACELRLDRGLSRRGVRASRNRHHTFILMMLASESSVAESIDAQKEERFEDRETWLKRAEQFLADARGESAEHPRVRAQAGQIKVARGEYRAALEDLRAADEAYRGFSVTDWSNKLLLARVHLRLGEAGSARRVIENVLPEARATRARDVSLWLIYAQALIETDDLERARALTEGILRSNPDHERARQVMAAIHERQGDPAGAGAFIAGGSGDNALQTILEARKLAMEGDMTGAIAILMQALKNDPANVPLVSATVTELINRDRVGEAKDLVDRAMVVDPTNTDLKKIAIYVAPDLSKEDRDAALQQQLESEPDGFRRNLDLTAFFMQREQFQEALDAITEAEKLFLSKDTPSAKKANVGQYRALLRLKMRLAGQLDDDQAMMASRDAAATHNVDGSGGKSILGLFHMIRNEHDLAIQAFRAAVMRQPSDAWSFTLLGQNLYQTGRLDEAGSAFENATRISVKNGLAYKGLAIIAHDLGNTDAFERHFRTCERLIPTDAWVQAVTTDRQEQANPAAAIERREATLAENPNDTANVKRLAYLCETTGDIERADRYYEQLLRLAPDDNVVATVTAAYYRRTNRSPTALVTLQAFANTRTPGEDKAKALLQVAAHHLNLNELDLAEQAMLAAAKENESLDVTLALADFYMQSTIEPKKAMPWLDKAATQALASAPGKLSRVLQARIQCRLSRSINDTAGAQKDVDLLQSRFPDDAARLLWQSEVYAQSGRLTDAIKVLTDYLAQRPNHVEALYRRARHHIAQGHINSALGDLQAIKQLDPLALDLKPRLLLASLLRRVDRNDDGLLELESLARDAPDSALAMQALVDGYIIAGRTARADQLVTAQINRGGDAPDPRWFMLRGRLSQTLGEYDKALADFRRGTEAQGLDTTSLAIILDTFLFAKQYDEGIDYYNQCADSLRETLPIMTRSATLLVQAGKLQAGAERFRKAMKLVAKQPSSGMTDVTIALQRSYPDEAAMTSAMQWFTGSARQGELGWADARLRTRLLRLAARLNDSQRKERLDQAAEELSKLFAHTADDTNRALILHDKGEVLEATKRHAEARQAYEEALNYGENWSTLNNLAYLLSDTLHENATALPYAKRAAALTDDPNVLDTLGWIYVGLGDYTTAIAELSRSLRFDPDGALTQTHLGEAYRRDGQFTEARDTLRGAIDLARRQGRDDLVSDAEASLARVEAGDRTP